MPELFKSASDACLVLRDELLELLSGIIFRLRRMLLQAVRHQLRAPALGPGVF